MPPFRPETAPAPAPDLAGALGLLCSLAGTTPPAVSGPERQAFFDALPELSARLAPIVPALGGGLLARLLVGPRFDGEPSPRSLPKEARKALAAGELLASADADAWIIEENADGRCRISHAHPESFEVLGESLGQWLAGEAKRIAAARAPRPAKGASGKPAIDAALARLGGDAATLAALKPGAQDTPWDYLLRAVAACGPVWSPALLASLEGRLLGRVLSGRLHDSEDEACIVDEDDDELDGVNPIYVDRYPKAARKVLNAGHFIASSGPELWILLRDAKGAKMSWTITLYHAAYDGFEELGTLEQWLARELER